MAKTYKLVARTVSVNDISEFTLDEGETLEARVIREIDDAAKNGKLDRMATRVGLPPIAVFEIGEGQNLAGGQNVVNQGLFAPDGSSLATRRFRVDPAGNGMFTSIAIHDDQGAEVEKPIGVFTDEGVAESVGLFWRNGHLLLPA